MPKKENSEMAGGKVSKSDSSRSRGRRLAQRARSFKEDLLERFTQMRSPSSARSSSPSKSSPRAAGKSDTLPHSADSSRRNEKDVHQLQRDVQFALRYFHDVVDKDTLEMLPGSATIVLENILAIHTLLKNCLAGEQSSLLLSTTNQVYQSLANLIRWADNVLLYGNHNHNKENVAEVVKDVRDAIKTLIELADDKLQSKESRAVANNVAQHNGICTLKPIENSSPKRTSLPDITLTPREREILELQTTTVDDSAIQLTSTPSSLDTLFFNNDDLSDSASRGEVPPPKPPLPHHWGSAWRCPSAGNMADVIPPLPPKRKTVHVHSESLGSSFQSMGSWNGNTSPHQHHPQHFRHHGNSLTALLGTDFSGSHDANGHDLSRTSSSEWGSEFGSTPNSVSPMNASANSLDSVLDRSADELTSTTATSTTTTTTVESREHFSSSSRISSTVMTANEELHRLNTTLQKFSVHQEMASSSSITTSIGINSTTGSSQTTTWSMFGQQQSTSSTTESSSCRCASTSSDTPLLPPPPAIPPKKRNLQRTPSQYDNLPELVVMDSSEEEHGGNSPLMHRRTTTEVRTSASAYCVFEKSESSRTDNGQPPPLPPKKKHIMAYMQMFGNCSEPNKNEFFRHSLHTYNLLQAQWQQQQHQSEMSFTNLRYLEMMNTHLRSSSDDADSSGYGSGIIRHSVEESLILSPPALPPKRNRGSVVSNRSRQSTSPTNPSPMLVDLKEKSNSMIETGSKDSEAARVVAQPSSQKSSIEKKSDPEEAEENCLDNLEVENSLVHKKPGEEGPDIRGGSVDALIVRATKVNKNDFMYQEAFLTTYRTFISPLELIKKLLYRYNKFSIMTEVTRQRAARNAFALLVRLVDDLCVNDIEEIVLSTLMDFVFQLLCNGDLILARALRKKILEKCEAKKRAGSAAVVLLSSFSVTTRQSILLDFKSEQLAEQMTLLDADLFQKIEIPEVLIWAREQSEELSPNLTTFTEHFNKMSYWARSRILEQDDAKDREKYVVKFIKIMKHLRKLNNFNSYLAILSALDSAPIRRLEWQRQITEGLKEYCELIDSSSSFRAYRQALADTEPPCIPYIGLILQDLTFVHIGNSDSLGDNNVVNFSKRWQQFNILDNMRRFKKCNYHFKRHEKIIAFFNNFDDYLCEEAMWQISESIKPRGGKKKSDHL